MSSSNPLERRQGIGAPPALGSGFEVYDSYTTDPKFQRYFTYFWLALLGIIVLLLNPFPALVRSRRLLSGWTIWEDLDSAAYRPLPSSAESPTPPIVEHTPASPPAQDHASSVAGWRRLSAPVFEAWATVMSFTPPVPTLPHWLGGAGGQDYVRKSYLSLKVGQVLLAVLYAAGVWVCVCKDAQLRSNPNRFGFIALAQLTPLFLLATKNNPLSLLVGMSYNHFNWAHRWSGRLVWLSATCHGCSWIRQYSESTSSKHILNDPKARRGYVAYGFLCLIAISSIKPIRQRAYALFWTLHFLSFIGFFAAIAYHTPYAQPWIFPPVALYTYDLFARLFKTRIADAVLVPVGDSTLIHLPDLNRGWLPTQHVYLRVLTASWSTFESHPFTILSSPSSANSSSPRQGLTLLAANSGNWTSALHALASTESEYEKRDGGVVQVRVIVDGPYGGWTSVGGRGVEEVICIVGGSGVSYLIGVAEEAARAMRETRKGSKLRLVRLVWVIRDYSQLLSLLPLISPVLSPSITLSVHLTRPPTSSPPASPAEHITLSADYVRPDLSILLCSLLDGDGPTQGVQVLGCGPAALVAEVGNAVAGLGGRERAALGGVEMGGEGFGL